MSSAGGAHMHLCKFPAMAKYEHRIGRYHQLWRQSITEEMNLRLLQQKVQQGYRYPSTYYLSNFRKLLQKLRGSHYVITGNRIRIGLNNAEQRAWDEISDDLSVQEKAIRYWTSDHYDNIQMAIGQDNEKELGKYMPLILAITKYIKNNPLKCEENELVVCYRKSKLRGEQLRFFQRGENGKVFLSKLFSATTLNINLLFAWQGNTIIKFIIDKKNGGHKRACNISHLSQHVDEQEILLLPYTAMQFVGYKSFTLPRYVLY